MRSVANYYDASKRAVGRDKFFKKLAEFLDVRVEGDGSGWAPVSNEDQSTLYDLIYEMIALKWGVDADSDLPINFELVNRNKGRMIAVRVPYYPYHNDPNPDRAQVDATYVAATTRAAANLSHSASELMRQIQNHMDDVESHRREAQERKTKLQETLAVINGRTDESQYEEDRDMVIFMSKPRAYDAKTKDAGIFSNDPDAQKALQAAMAVKYPKRLAKAVRDIAKVMSQFEDDDSDGYYNEVTAPRLEFVRVFGDAFNKHPKIGPVAQEQFQKGKAKRTARRAAAQKA